MNTLSPKKRAPRNAKNRGRGISYPMDIGDEIEVDIFDIAPNGEGVAKIKGFPVFIKNAKLNEHVKIRITALVSGAADAELVS
jgi:predicted RNA-binding protein with TRAM domain